MPIMNIQINGQTKEIKENTTLSDIVAAFSPNNNKVVAELNEAIISSNDWGNTVIQANDNIELVAFVGGG
jgi:thiamine biosynthesis protein ThiS